MCLNCDAGSCEASVRQDDARIASEKRFLSRRLTGSRSSLLGLYAIIKI